MPGDTRYITEWRKRNPNWRDFVSKRISEGRRKAMLKRLEAQEMGLNHSQTKIYADNTKTGAKISGMNIEGIRISVYGVFKGRYVKGSSRTIIISSPPIGVDGLVTDMGEWLKEWKKSPAPNTHTRRTVYI